MSTDAVRSPFLDATVAAYAAAHLTPPDEVVRRMRATTSERFPDAARMQIGHDQAVLLEMLTRAMGVRQAVEVGTFTGTSSLAIARGLPPGGRLLCCDVNEEWTSVAREAWEAAGVADRVELRLAPALETLRALPDEPVIDLSFVDADKVGYADYYAELLPRTRPGGLVLFDNTLQRGRVADPSADDESAVAIRAFNDMVLADPSVVSVLLPLGDGVTFVQKPA